MARVDLGLGVLAAIVLLLITPGLAITFLVAIVVLAVCTVSIVREHLHRRARPAPSRRREPPASTQRPQREPATGEPRPQREAPRTRRARTGSGASG